MITAPLPRASPSGTGRLSMIIPQYYELTISYIYIYIYIIYIRTDPITLPCSLARTGNNHQYHVNIYNCQNIYIMLLT